MGTFVPIILSTVDNGDGTSNVTIATANYSTGVAIVRNDIVGTVAAWPLLEHVARLTDPDYHPLRQSRRDQQARGG